MRIAFVLQIYLPSAQAGRLIDVLNRGCPNNLVVLVHSGPRAGIGELVRQRKIDRVLPAAPGRGRFGMIDGYMSALRWLRRQGKPYDWIVLLSGQDYPIRSFGEFSAELERSSADGYFYHFDPLDKQAANAGPLVWTPNEAEDRYSFRYIFLKDELSRAGRALWKIPRLALGLTRNWRLNTSYGLCVGQRAETTPFSTDFRLFGGSYWHIIRRAAGEALLDFADDNSDVVNYFRRVILPDEAFIPTVLLNNKAFRISPRDLRYFDFTGSRQGHPKTLGPADLDAAFASGCFFARKFDARVNAGLLDQLDARVFG